MRPSIVNPSSIVAAALTNNPGLEAADKVRKAQNAITTAPRDLLEGNIHSILGAMASKAIDEADPIESGLTVADVGGTDATKQRTVSTGSSGTRLLPFDSTPSAEEQYSTELEFPGMNQNINRGNVYGRIIGSQPIFVGSGAVVPMGIVDQRRRSLRRAAAEKQERNKSLLELVTANGAQQYNARLSQIKYDFLTRTLEKVNYDVDRLFSYNNPDSMEFWSYLKKLRTREEETLQLNTMSSSIITDAVDEKKYVTASDLAAARAWMEGSMDIENFINNDEEFESVRKRLRSYSNLAYNIKNLAPKIESMVIDMGSDLSSPEAAKDLNEATEAAHRTGDAVYIVNAIKKHVPKERVQTLAGLMKESGSYVQTEKEIEEYLWAHIGSGEIDWFGKVLPTWNRAKSEFELNAGSGSPKQPAGNEIAATVRGKMYGEGTQTRTAEYENLATSFIGSSTDKVKQGLGSYFHEVNWTNGVYATGTLPLTADQMNTSIKTAPLENTSLKIQDPSSGAWVSPTYLRNDLRKRNQENKFADDSPEAVMLAVLEENDMELRVSGADIAFVDKNGQPLKYEDLTLLTPDDYSMRGNIKVGLYSSYVDERETVRVDEEGGKTKTVAQAGKGYQAIPGFRAVLSYDFNSTIDANAFDDFYSSANDERLQDQKDAGWQVSRSTFSVNTDGEIDLNP